jgi:hypothetical protein
MTVSIRKLRERLTAGSLPQLPEELAVARDQLVVAALLGLGAEGVDEAHDRGVHVDGHGGAGAAAGDGADHGDVRRHVEPAPAVGPGDRGAEDALAPEVAPALDRVLPDLVVVGGARRDALARDLVDAIDERLLRWREGSHARGGPPSASAACGGGASSSRPRASARR